ncbi:hypothetical protein RQP46_010839 [Phenoliferia psychrophenolica]
MSTNREALSTFANGQPSAAGAGGAAAAASTASAEARIEAHTDALFAGFESVDPPLDPSLARTPAASQPSSTYRPVAGSTIFVRQPSDIDLDPLQYSLLWAEAAKATKSRAFSAKVKEDARVMKARHQREMLEFSVDHGVRYAELRKHLYGATEVRRAPSAFNKFQSSDLLKEMAEERGIVLPPTRRQVGETGAARNTLVAELWAELQMSQKRSFARVEEDETSAAEREVLEVGKEATDDQRRDAYKVLVGRITELCKQGEQLFNIQHFAFFATSDSLDQANPGTDISASDGGAAFLHLLGSRSSSVEGYLYHMLSDFKTLVAGQGVERKRTGKKPAPVQLFEALAEKTADSEAAPSRKRRKANSAPETSVHGRRSQLRMSLAKVVLQV